MFERNDHLIEGWWVPAAGTELIEVVSPSTEEVVGCVPAAIEAEVDSAVAATRGVRRRFVAEAVLVSSARWRVWCLSRSSNRLPCRPGTSRLRPDPHCGQRNPDGKVRIE
jgi:hypothetical protein